MGGEPDDLCNDHPLVEEHNLRCSCTTEASEVVAVRHDGFVLKSIAATTTHAQERKESARNMQGSLSACGSRKLREAVDFKVDGKVHDEVGPCWKQCRKTKHASPWPCSADTHSMSGRLRNECIAVTTGS